MKKILATILTVLACVCSMAAIACQKTFTVTFDANGGLINGQSSVSVEVIAEAPVDNVGFPEKDGETFICWTLDGEKYDFTSRVSSNITLVASYGTSKQITFVEAENDGFDYVFSTEEAPSNVAYGTTVEFEVSLDAFKDGPITVKANGAELTADSQTGKYSVVVTENTQITVEGVVDAVSSMVGSGTSTDPFIVEKPIDLIFIADKVNAGVEQYVTGYYIMYNDIDFKGEELKIIGDLSTDYSYFNGYFNGNTYAIKNFVINAVDKSYVGVFGCVMANPYDSSLGTIYALKLSDYVINASTTQDLNIFCGSYVGYAQGANLYLCIAENGEINVQADEHYYAYVGGVTGIQQSLYLEDYDARFVSSVAYANIDVDVYAISGAVIAAGGISGALYSTEDNCTSYITSSFTSGTVSGAVRTGGLVGILGSYSAIANCYTVGDVIANTEMNDETIYGEYVYAYAGGIVGYAENDSSVVDCFAVGAIDASASSNKYAITGGIIGGKDPDFKNDFSSVEAVDFNCYYAEGGVDEANGINLKDPNFITDKLHWQEYDWIIGEYDGIVFEYPGINYGEYEGYMYLTVSYNGETVGGRSSSSLTIPGVHVTLCYWLLNGDLSSFVLSDTGLGSYGYFFDKECTLKVPIGFFATRDITLYVGFKDYSEVAGTYYLQYEGSTQPLTVILSDDGTFTYTDGTQTTQSTYIYNGDYIVLENARLARYSNVTLTDSSTGDAQSNVLKHNLYSFRADITDSGIAIYDGSYFTEESPLIAVSSLALPYGEYYAEGENDTYVFSTNSVGYHNGVKFNYSVNGTQIIINNQACGTYQNGVITINGAVLKQLDEFAGTWEASSTANKTFTFDGKGGWSMIDNSGSVTVQESGNYTVSNIGALQLTMKNGTQCVASIDDGYVTIKVGNYVQTYYAQNSYKGVWTNVSNQITLTLNGINASGLGTGVVDYADVGSYDITYMANGTNSIVVYSEEIGVIGFFNYISYRNTISAEMYLASTAEITSGLSFVHHDNYEGEWISQSDLFTVISFNGYGYYNVTDNGIGGVITIGDEEVQYELVSSTLNGSFTYKGTTYSISYDEVTGTITLSAGANQITLQRKDSLANIVLSDANGNDYTFNGYGELSGGVMTETKADGTVTEYSYTVTDSGITFGDGGSITIGNNKYVYSYGGNSKDLLIKNEFFGQWAVSGEYNTLDIGLMGLDGKIEGKYLGSKVEITYINAEKLSFTHSGTTYYVFMLDKENAAISTSTRLNATNYTALALIDEVYGKIFVHELGMTLEFDGMAKSTYTYGNAKVTTKTGTVTNYTYDYDKNGGLMMWTTDSEVPFNYKLQPCETNEKGAYVCGSIAYKLVDIDSFYLIVATDYATGKTYEFDGMSYTNSNGHGKVTCSDGTEYEYRISAFNDNSTADVTLYDKDGNYIFVIVDYSNGQDIKIIFNNNK